MLRLLSVLALAISLTPAGAQSQSCTGLCLQQVSCPNNGTTTVTGVIYAPNGIDPLPNVTVYIPNAAVDAFTPGVSCPVIGAPPSGSPLIGAITNVDGTFTLVNVPVGTNIPLVAVSGRWRRQVAIPSTTACTNTQFSTRMPQTQAEGDIPKIAIATGSVDQVECVLRKVGIADSEFTDPSGTGRVNLFSSNVAGAGAVLDASTPSQADLMGNGTLLNQYDVLMLPCEGAAYNKPAAELANLIGFANAGGRVYSSHYSYSWMYKNPPFDTVVNWFTPSQTLPDGVGTVDQSFSGGQTLAQWLQLVGASTTLGQMPIQTVRKDFNGVNAPTQSWITFNDTAASNPVMQFVFDTPIAATNQCGKVLFNEYHVENGNSTPRESFPIECGTGAMTPQEKLLEYSLFELTSEGGQPTLNPTSADFGSEAFNFTTAPKTFVWKNNSSFTYGVTSITTSGDFAQTNNCSSVAAGGTCTISVAFTPTALGSRTGTLTVQSSGGNTLTAPLTGTGVPGYTISGTSLAWGNQDIGKTVSQTLTVTNIAPSSLPVPPFATTGNYSVDTSSCGNTIAANGSCTVAVSFKPPVTGEQDGTLAVNSSSLLYNGLSAKLTGNGVDFAMVLLPTSGKVVSGDSASATATLTPLAGFSAPVTVSCTIATAATGANCTLNNTSFTLSTQTSAAITISTTSKYTVVGYGGLGGPWLWIIGTASGGLLLLSRRKIGRKLSLALVALIITTASASLTGCSGKLPTQNPSYTAPGSYVVTVNATDGFLIRTANYTLTVH